MGDLGSIPGLGRSPREGNGNPLQYSSLENSMGGGAWQATVHGVAKSWTGVSNFTFFFFSFPIVSKNPHLAGVEDEGDQMRRGIKTYPERLGLHVEDKIEYLQHKTQANRHQRVSMDRDAASRPTSLLSPIPRRVAAQPQDSGKPLVPNTSEAKLVAVTEQWCRSLLCGALLGP